jgi:hypothetical protein
MSLSEKIDFNCEDKNEIQVKSQLIDGKYSKDSFDRYGDDLCEKIFSFLSIEQKLKFECVSKQWKHLIFNKQQKLIISDYKPDFDTLRNPDNRPESSYIWEIIFKKLKYLKIIKCDSKIYLTIETLDLITKKCRHLEEIDFDFRDRYLDTYPGRYDRYFRSEYRDLLYKQFDWNLFEKFAKKCGQKLRFISIKGINYTQKKLIFRFTPNLKTLVENTDSKTLIETNLPNLEEIRDFELSCDDDFQSFADIYCKQIKKLHFQISASNSRFKFVPQIFASNSYSNYNLNHSLKNLWRFENLEDLKICLALNEQEIYNEFQLMADKLKKLKRLEVYIVGYFNINEFFEIIGSFKSLEQLYFKHSGDDSCSPSCLCIKNSRLKLKNLFPLKSCEKLKIIHLTTNDLSDESLEDIHLYLPQLKSVILRIPVIKDKTMINLAKLQNLFKLEIQSYNITVSGVCEYIKISPNIKTIILNEKYFDEKIIEALIERANNNPRLKYEFTACERFDKKEVVIDDRFPPNLIVKRIIYRVGNNVFLPLHSENCKS